MKFLVGMKIKVLVSLRIEKSLKTGLSTIHALTVRPLQKRVCYERVRSVKSRQSRVALRYLRTSLTFVHICIAVNKLGKKTDDQNTIKAQRRRFHPAWALLTAAFRSFYIAIPLYQRIVKDEMIWRTRARRNKGEPWQQSKLQHWRVRHFFYPDK